MMVLKTIRREYVCSDCDRVFEIPDGAYVGVVAVLCRSCRVRFERLLGFKRMKRVCDRDVINDPSRVDYEYVRILPRSLRPRVLESYQEYIRKNRRRRNARMPDVRKRWVVSPLDISEGEIE